MKVSGLSPALQFQPVALETVKPGRVVCYDKLDGTPEFYLVTKMSSLEMPFIALPPDHKLLVNLLTGRAVIKHGRLQVHPTSCTAETYYTEK